MKTIRELKEYGNSIKEKLQNEILDIHPKMLSVLSYSDFWDKTLVDNVLRDEYNVVNKKVNEFNKEIYSESLDYYISLALDMQMQGINIGYNSDGSELDLTNNYSFNFYYTPSFEMEPFYNAIKEFNKFISFTPYWLKNYQILVKNSFGISSYIDIINSYSPETFILSNKGRISSANYSSLNDNDVFIMYNKVILNTPYKMNESVKSNVRPSDVIMEFNNNVRAHKILEELLKHPSGTYKLTDIMFNNEKQNLDINLKKV